MALRSLLGAAIAACLLVALPPSPAAAQNASQHPHQHDHGDGHSHGDEFAHLPPSFGLDLTAGWLDPWTHADYSRRGTPFVHLFLTEPAYLDRDLFIDFTWMEGDEGAEYEVETEVEYAITRRIGVVLEAPFAYLDPEEGDSERGPGDIAIAPRFLLVEYDRFLLSANLEFEFPTGDEDRGLGAGETIFGPSLSTWVDLGGDFSFQGNIGLEQGLESDMTAMTWGAALTYSLYLGGKPAIVDPDGAVRSHFPVGLLSLIAELRGEHPLDGEDEGSGTATAVLGASYTFAPALEIRAGFMFPAWEPREFDHGVIVGLIWHF
jgi:hypothetical protein